MAKYNGIVAVHPTFTTGIDTVTLSGVNDGPVTVLKRTADDELYFTYGTNGEVPADPVPGGDDCYVIPAAIGIASFIVGGRGCIVKVTSTGTPEYSVQAL